ncbi:hypothetical protein [Corynebacterium pacaense]|uniref:hypothetical protein n=1 Tax=Corynebacterium pacaense TaxID=1816684 RepID=UPI0015C4693C|nr:hypothetical protein [Corynebacterium pacaense]
MQNPPAPEKDFSLEPAPVSKHNLYVLIGCTALVVALVFLGPYIYPLIQQFDPFGIYQ